MLPTDMAIYTGEGVGGLLQLNRTGLTEYAQQIFERFPTIAGAYLFGSALELVRPTSDVDIGLILPKTLYGQDLSWGTDAADKKGAEISLALGSWGGHPFQVTVLREDNPSFVMRVLRRARLIYAADTEYISNFLEHVAQINDDVEPFRRVYFAARRME